MEWTQFTLFQVLPCFKFSIGLPNYLCVYFSANSYLIVIECSRLGLVFIRLDVITGGKIFYSGVGFFTTVECKRKKYVKKLKDFSITVIYRMLLFR